MTVSFTKKFWKKYYKLPKAMQVRFDERLKLLLADPTSPVVKLHPLKGQYAGYWSINVTGDLRAHYKMEGNSEIIFTTIGTHSQLY